MVDPRHRQEPAPDALPPISRRAKWAAGGVLVLVAGGVVFWLFRSVNEGRAQDRWTRLAKLQSGREDPSPRGWLEVPVRAGESARRNEYATSLEDLLEKDGPSDPALAAHIHAALASLEASQALGLSMTSDAKVVDEHYANAERHLRALAGGFPSAPANWDRLKPPEASSVARRMLNVLVENRKWEADNARKSVDLDPDVVVLLRTDRGDLRLRTYGSASPSLVKGFLERASRGDYDGTLLFEKRDGTDEAWVRGGSPRTRTYDPTKPLTDEVRKTWNDETPADPLLPESGRYRIAHTKGIVTSWHPASESADVSDDAMQFLIIANKESPYRDSLNTPFARVEEVSLPTLDRIIALSTVRQAKPDSRGDYKVMDQFVEPVKIVKALVYEKGALRAGSEGRASESERTLGSVKIDEYKKSEPKPPVPPAAGAAMDGAMEDGMDVGGMDAAMDAAMSPEAPPTPPTTPSMGGA